MPAANLADYTVYGVPVHYAGCYQVAPTSPVTVNGVTQGVQQCLSDGKMEQYAFLGTVSYGTGSELAKYHCDTLATAATKVNDYLCNAPCHVETTAICGSQDGTAYSAYYLNTYSRAVLPYQLTKPVELDPTVTSAKADYKGCFPRSALTFDNVHVFGGLTNASMTVEMCVDACAQIGAKTAWIQSGTFCSCGDQSSLTTNFAQNPDDACDAGCPGYTDGTFPAGGTATCGGKNSDFPNDKTQVRVSLYGIDILALQTAVDVFVPLSGTILRQSSLNNQTVTSYYLGCYSIATDPVLISPHSIYSPSVVPYPTLLTIQQCLDACDPNGGNVTWALLTIDISTVWPNKGASGGCQCIRNAPYTGMPIQGEVSYNANCAEPLPGDNRHTIGDSGWAAVYASFDPPKTAQNFTTALAGIPVSYVGCYQIITDADIALAESSEDTAGYADANDQCLSTGYTKHFTYIYSGDGSGVACSEIAPTNTSKVANSFCNLPCEDDVDVACGGSFTTEDEVTTTYTSVYYTNSYAFSFPPYPIPKPTELNTSIVAATMTYGGCLPISQSPGDLRTVLNSATLTEAGCVDLCLQYGFITAVLQNSTICGCSESTFTASHDPDTNPESHCNAVCPGYNQDATTINVPHCGSVPIPVVPNVDPNAPPPPAYVPYGSFYALSTTFKQARTDKPSPLSSFNYTSLMNNDTLSVGYVGCYPISDPVLQAGPYRTMDTPYPNLLTIEQCIHACDPNGSGLTHPVLKQIAYVNWPNGANSECQCITGAMANLTSTPNESKCFSLLPGDNTHTMGYDDYVSVYSVVGPNNTVPGNTTTPSSSSMSMSMSASVSNSASVPDSATVSTSSSASSVGSVSASSSTSVSSSSSASTTVPPPATQPTVVPFFQVSGLTYRSQGCWGEPAQQPSPLRALPNRLYPGQQTVEACLTLAASQGFKKAGLEFGGECWASNGQVAGGAIPASYCTTVCVDNASEYCGGPNNLNLYFADGASSGAATVPSHTSGNNQWTYSSCWGEPAQGRALANKIIDSGATVGACLDLAASRGYGYAGLEYSGECWAAFSAPAGGQIDESYCNLACSSDGSQECGGSGALSYYKLAPVTKQMVYLGQSTWQYQSCYGEPAQGRSMPNPFDNAQGATVESCLQMGASAGFKNCGLEYGQECWCSNDNPFGGVIPESYCNMGCNKDNRELCGGGNVLSFYSRI